MAKNSRKTRRDFLKATAGVTGAATLAGCSTGNDRTENQDPTETDGTQEPTESNETQDSTESDESTTDTSTSEPTYSLHATRLEIDLTNLATSEADQHDEAYIEENHSAEPELTVLTPAEEDDIEQPGEVHLENEEGEEVQTTEEGYVPEYAVEDGQKLTVRAEVEGSEVTDSVTVNKKLPSYFYADATIQENGKVIYETDWSTPYRFDANIGENGEVTEDNTYEITRQQFHQQRTERRNELAGDELILESDLETWRGYFEEEEDELTEEEKKEYYLGGLGYAMEGGEHYEGTGADDNAFNVEKAMLEHSPYEPVFIGGFTNPKEPDVPSAGDGDGFPVDSQVAFVDGDWYQNDPSGSTHVDDIEETPMVRENPSQLAVSVLGEFERGNTDIENPREAEEYVETAVTSPVTLNGNMTELELSDDISWNTLKEIRDNTDWEEVMVPMELATAIGSDVEGSVSMEGETTRDSSLRVTR